MKAEEKKMNNSIVFAKLNVNYESIKSAIRHVQESYECK